MGMRESWIISKVYKLELKIESVIKYKIFVFARFVFNYNTLLKKHKKYNVIAKYLFVWFLKDVFTSVYIVLHRYIPLLINKLLLNNFLDVVTVVITR